MRQTTFQIDDEAGLASAVSAIEDACRRRPASSRLLIVVEPTDDVSQIQSNVSAVRNRLPHLPVVGVTQHWVGLFDLPGYSRLALSLIECETSTIQVFSYPYGDFDFSRAAQDFQARMEAVPDFRAALVYTANAFRPCTEFLERVSAAFPGVTFSGMLAGSPQTQADTSLVIANGEVSHDMLVVVAFSGQDLRTSDSFCLGWRPLGRDHLVTEVCEGGIRTIDNLPAVDLYRRYLEIEPDEDFGALALPFPLITFSNKLPVAHTVVSVGSQGELLFCSGFKVGEWVSLSYSKVDYLLEESLAQANALRPFVPQAMIMSPCLNRRTFLGKEAFGRELGYFQRLCPALVSASGLGEVYMRDSAGGILNSTLVALSLREGDPRPDEALPPIADSLLAQGHRVQTRAERLVTFLEVTSQELRGSYADMRELSRMDDLTGIPNRRYTMTNLDILLERWSPRRPVAVLMYDIDGFKQVNDRFGHQVGDDVLRGVSKRVGQTIRNSDFQGRWGGDEFLIIATNLSSDQALAMGERIRAAVEEAPFPAVGKVTISVGITCAVPDDDSDTIFSRVDSALYRSKERGRNCVSLVL